MSRATLYELQRRKRDTETLRGGARMSRATLYELQRRKRDTETLRPALERAATHAPAPLPELERPDHMVRVDPVLYRRYQEARKFRRVADANRLHVQLFYGPEAKNGVLVAHPLLRRDA